jgi:hypothetical protein
MTMVLKLLYNFLHSIIYRVLLVVANGNVMCLGVSMLELCKHEVHE